MLTHLKIKNFALLKDVSIDFGQGLNILTGETGAGKSIIIGALNIALGERGYTENIRSGEEKAEVEAVFELKEGSQAMAGITESLNGTGIEPSNVIIIKREINRASKGRIFINNSSCSLALLQNGRKIEAIKVYRERHGVGLKEAKDAVEELAGRHGIAAQGSGCAGVVLLGVLGAAAGVACLLA